MGRETTELWYDLVDVRQVRVLVIEWTHGNSDFIEGVDIPVLLNSTPRKPWPTAAPVTGTARRTAPSPPWCWSWSSKAGRPGLHKAKLILSKAGELMLDYREYRRRMMRRAIPEPRCAMPNAYPDSMGETFRRLPGH